MHARSLLRCALAVGATGCGAIFGVDFDDARPYGDGGFCPPPCTGGGGDDSGANGDSPGGDDSSMPATAIATGGQHACAIVESGDVRCWGMDKYGQLGSGTTDSATPITPSSLGARAIAIGAGAYHACAVLEGGAVRCWGDDSDGQLGDMASLGSGFTQVVGGDAHTCAITTGGGVTCWGSNASGQLGSNAPSGRAPVVVPGVSGVTAISAGSAFTCALANGGSVMCWGSNYRGALGIGSSSGGTSAPTAVMGASSGVSAISAGDTHACAVKGGGVMCWGGNSFGELGFANPTEADKPLAVPGLSGITAVSAGGDALDDDHTCAITGTKGVVCWGINSKGQLGRNATPLGGPVPGDVMGVSDVSTLASGGGFSCVLTSSGAVLCWGSNEHRQLGARVSDSQSMTPTRIVGL
jgi:alpha-tubulin suppressor-like RCC1 family protein